MPVVQALKRVYMRMVEMDPRHVIAPQLIDHLENLSNQVARK